MVRACPSRSPSSASWPRRSSTIRWCTSSSTARLVCVLATFDERHIHAVPMWFALRGRRGLPGHRLAQPQGSKSRAGDARATLVVHDSRPGFEVCGVSHRGPGRRHLGSGGGAARRASPSALRRRRRRARTSSVRAFLESDDVAIRFRPGVSASPGTNARASAARRFARPVRCSAPLLPTEPRP